MVGIFDCMCCFYWNHNLSVLVKKEIFGDEPYEDLSEQDFNQLKDIVTDILCTIKKNTSAINFWGNISLQKQLRTYIINVLLRNPLFSS